MRIPLGGVVPLLVAVPFLIGAAAAPSDQAREVFRFQDPEITESSGLTAAGGLFATVNDSGDTGRVFTVDGAGETVGTTHWSEEPLDVEALAPAGAGQVWVGDLGDNRAERESIEVRRVPVGPGERTATATVHALTYPDGAHDAETLLADPDTGRLYVVTKGLLGGQVYAAPARLGRGTGELRPLAGGVLPLATDGAVLPDGRHAILRNYTRAVLYTFPDFEPLTSWALPDQEQGETLAVDEAGRVYAGSEGVRAPVLWLRLPADVRRALAPPAPADPKAGATGSTRDGSAPAAERSADPADPALEDNLPRDPWPWILGGAVAVLIVVVLLRSLRPR
ncbi:hypothetical protein [Nocardioides insulae]|uniref:hypothetical protein n=1 Tax=Nocardioides insulae TaxID=394734 RepID=UPI000419165D|nr:hypothetical protein [Nocardioides insulae]